MKRSFAALIAVLPLLAVQPAARAEWRTESFALKKGWNAIYPLVDASHTTLDLMLAGHPDIEEVWRWQPERVDPIQPGDPAIPPTGLEWSVWRAGVPEETTFDQLQANYGYLVKLADSAPDQTLQVTGRPVPPEVRWRTDGLHLAGFPVLAAGITPSFASYLAPTGFALSQSEILRYIGGPITAGVNPALVNPSINRITRGQAYWIRVEKFSRYYGPLSVDLDYGESVTFGTRSEVARMVLKNETNTSLTVVLDSVASAPAPAGQTVIAGQLPLLAQVDAETEFAALGTRTITIPAASVIQVRLLPDRLAMAGGSVGDRFSALLHLKTTAGIAGQEVFLAATAEKGSMAGLWVGEAQISQVGSVVRRYARDAAGETIRDAQGNPILVEDQTTPGGATELPAVPRPYTLRMIVHVDDGGQARMLSHIYQGRLEGAAPLAPLALVTDESLLDQTALKQAVRLSVAHLPLDTRLALSGAFVTGGTLASAADLVTPHTSPVNPFLHVYHPDHDNLDARYGNPLPAGRESFEIRRQIGLTFDAGRPTDLPTSWGATLMSGMYEENISGVVKPGTTLRVRGPFVLHKVSDTGFISGF